MTPLYLDWNLGLGDSIICNGLVRALAESERRIILPSWPRNLPSVRHMFSDLENVDVIVPLNGDGPLVGGPDLEVLSIGLHGTPYEGSNSESFDQHFYRRAGLPWEYRYSKFALPKDTVQIAPPRGDFRLIHGRASDGASIQSERLSRGWLNIHVENNVRWPLAAWVDTIAAASEIHCLDSSFIHLVESVPSTDNLFFHEYARPSYFQRRKPWTILK